MSINEIQLNKEILLSFYNKCLVLDTPTPSKTASSGKGVTILYGGPKKNKTADMEFLGGILKACHLSPEEVSIIEKNESPISNLLNHEGGKILIFGEHDERLGEVDFQPILMNNTEVLTAPALETISSSKELKMKLWNCLKMIFNIV